MARAAIPNFIIALDFIIVFVFLFCMSVIRTPAMYVYTYTLYMYMSNNRTKFLDIAISSSFYDIVIASPLKHHAIVPTNWAKPIFRCSRSGSGCGIHPASAEGCG